MAITIIPTKFGSMIVTLSLVDENEFELPIEDLITPKWQLMRKKDDGSVEIVNSRSFANGSMTALTWELTGRDLQYEGKHIIAVQAKYQTTVDGRAVTLDLTDEEEFTVRDLKSQPSPDNAQ